jgi:hypothetical protein
LPAYFTRHAAVWCSDFPLVSLATYQRSSAIDGKYITVRKVGKQEGMRICFHDSRSAFPEFLLS